MRSLALVLLLFPAVAAAQAVVTAPVDVCEVPGFGPCDTAARASLVVTTGAVPSRVRVLRLERMQDGAWVRLAVTRLQLDTNEAVAARATLDVPAGGAHTLGVLHAPRPLGHGIRYRVTLEVDGQRVVLEAREDLVIRHPLPD